MRVERTNSASLMIALLRSFPKSILVGITEQQERHAKAGKTVAPYLIVHKNVGALLCATLTPAPSIKL